LERERREGERERETLADLAELRAQCGA